MWVMGNYVSRKHCPYATFFVVSHAESSWEGCGRVPADFCRLQGLEKQPMQARLSVAKKGLQCQV